MKLTRFLQLTIIFVGVIALVGSVLIQPAEASVLTFSAHNHPSWGNGKVGGWFATYDDYSRPTATKNFTVVRDFFSFNKDMRFTVDTSTGKAVLEGTMLHHQRRSLNPSLPSVTLPNPDTWYVKATFNNIRDIAGGSLLANNGGPYSQMFKDLENLGVGSGEGFSWDDVKMSMGVKNADGAVDYMGEVDWFEKANAQGDTSILKWGKFVDGEFGVSNWMRAHDTRKDHLTNFRGDFHFGLTPVVPEPATMALFGTGLAGLALRRRKKNQA